jgi:hypothetical protein
MLTANPDIDLVVSFFFSFLLLIAGIDVDDGGKRQKMSLLVIAIFFPWFIQLSDACGRKKEKKIVHPIGDTRGCRKFWRLACMSLYAAGGHDWSKTENEHIEKRSALSSVYIYQLLF